MFLGTDWTRWIRNKEKIKGASKILNKDQWEDSNTFMNTGEKLFGK